MSQNFTIFKIIEKRVLNINTGFGNPIIKIKINEIQICFYFLKIRHYFYKNYLSKGHKSSFPYSFIVESAL